MAGLPTTVDEYVDYLGLITNTNYSEQQVEVIRNFNKSLIVFADPGTGKTHTVLAGLFSLMHIHKVPADNIVAMSFTKAATGEMSARYDKLCKKMGVRPKLKFRTIHSLSYSLLFDNASVFGTRELGILKKNTFADKVELVEVMCADFNVDISKWKMRKVAQAISSLNSTFSFSRESVTDSLAFKECGIDYETFTLLRNKIYRYHRISGKIPRPDLCLYALDALVSNPELVAYYKEKYKVIIIDEAQDLSLIQLKLLSMLTDNLIIIGDMKQQIHGYAGACSEVVEWFNIFYPNSESRELTQSFRCTKEIAELSKRIIKDNDMGGENFTGTDRPSTIHVTDNLDFADMVSKLKSDLARNNGMMPYQLMFLYRNNISEVQIAEELWKARVPCKIEKHINATEVPVISDLVALVELAYNPRIIYNLNILLKIIPEFKKFDRVELTPTAKIMKAEGCDFFSANYDYRGNGLVLKLIRDLQEVHERRNDRTFLARDAFNLIYKSYYNLYLKEEEHKNDMETSYYISLVAPLLEKKTFRAFKQDEVDKQLYMQEQLKESLEGVRCMTIHTAKGKESDRVVVLDVNEGLFPQTKKIKAMLEQNCILEAARAIRNERSLLFVAVTRARNNLTITYKDTLADLFLGISKYSAVEAEYKYRNRLTDELSSFNEFCGSGGGSK